MDMETEFFKNKILPLKQKLFRKALYITQSQADAEDIVQEVMLRMWDNKKEWPNINNIEGFCSLLTRNLAIDRIRQSGFRHESIDSDSFLEVESTNQLPIEKLIQTDEKKWVLSVIASLPPKQQEVIRLREIEELSYKDIALELSLSETQVKIILFRARQTIKEVYQKISKYGL